MGKVQIMHALLLNRNGIVFEENWQLYLKIRFYFVPKMSNLELDKFVSELLYMTSY